MKVLSFISLLFIFIQSGWGQEVTEKKQYNILFIAIDDLNDWTGFLGGHPQTLTPNLDKLASEALVFENAQCPASVCNPSRSSIMTGIRPSTSGVYGNKNFFRDSEILKDAKTIPQYLADFNYKTISSGKIFHNPNGPWADVGSWQEYREVTGNYGKINKEKGFLANGIPVGEIKANMDWYPTDGIPETTLDYLTMEWGAEQLKKQTHNKPFFMALGISKPHLKWEVPKQFFDKFSLENIVLPEVKLDDFNDIPKVSPGSSNEYYVIKKVGKEKELVQAYLAAINYADFCVGRILNALEVSPFKDNTIVIVWGDHGWHLGEKLRYRKATLWEEATRVPFIIKVPGVTIPNSRSLRPVNLIDLYPTITELCNLPKNETNEGVSFVPLLIDPNAEWEMPSLTTMGFKNHSLRDEKFRYIQYKDKSKELYDLSNDPMGFINLASDPKYAQVISNFKKYLPKKNTMESKKSKKDNQD